MSVSLEMPAVRSVASGAPDDLPIVRDQDFQAPQSRTVGQGIGDLTDLSDLERSDRLARMKAGTLGSVHSWELVTAVDGPGTRMTIFLNGCPLRCQYCHNPDTFEMRYGAPVSSDELLGRIKRYRRIFRATGGGITLSGGEVLMQPAFAATLLRGAKEMGVHTCLDTSGFLGASATEEMLDNTDLVLLDVKSGDPDIYRTVTGRDLQPTIDFGARLHERGMPVWIRFVLVPGLTDDDDNIEKIGEIIRPWSSTIERVEVLPFHQMGRDKWKKMNYTYTLEATQPPTPQRTEEVRDYFRSLGFEVH